MTNRTETLICKHLVMSSVAGESTTNYYDPVEIIEIEDEDYEIVELDD